MNQQNSSQLLCNSFLMVGMTGLASLFHGGGLQQQKPAAQFFIGCGCLKASFLPFAPNKKPMLTHGLLLLSG
jgi:hypothetical protein